MAKTKTPLEDETSVTAEEQAIPEAECATLIDVSLVEARLLVDCIYGKCNQIVMLTPEQVQLGLRAHCIDNSPAAIAAAKTVS